MVAKNEDLAVTSESFRVVQLKNCIAALDLMAEKTRQLLTDLEGSVEYEHEHLGPEPSGILQMYVSRVDRSIENRCGNLRSTLRAIERERLRAQNEIDVASRVTKI